MSQNLNLLPAEILLASHLHWQKNRSSLSFRGRVPAGEIPACDSTKNRFFIFKNSIRTVFNRPIETKRAVQNYRYSQSLTSKAATNWLSKSLRILSPQPTNLRASPRTFLFKRTKPS